MIKLDITEKEAIILFLPAKPAIPPMIPSDERINILFKDGTVKDISEVDNALIHQHLSSTVKKYYICYLRSS